MYTSVYLGGLPLNKGLDAYIPTGADPGVFVCEAITDESLLYYGEGVTLTINTGLGQTLQFPRLRPKVEPARKGGAVRLVLVDERYLLEKIPAGPCWNPTLPDGTQAAVAMQKTLQQVWAEIATATGFTIDASNLSTSARFAPAVKHENMKTLVQELLYATASRMLWDGEAGTWVIRHVSASGFPEFASRANRPAAKHVPAQITVRTAPTIYQSDLTVENVIYTTAGGLQTLGALGITPSSYFNGFAGDLGGQDATTLQTCAFRLWRATGGQASGTVDDVRLIPCRYEPIAPGCPPVAHDAFFHGTLCNFDHYPYTDAEVRSFAKMEVNGSNLAVSSEPVLPWSSNALSDTCTLRTAYNLAEGAGLKRKTRTYAVGGLDATPYYVDLPQIVPLEVSHSNTKIDNTAWQTQADALGPLHAARLGVPSSQAVVNFIADMSPFSATSAIRYRVHMEPLMEVQTIVQLGPETSGPFAY